METKNTFSLLFFAIKKRVNKKGEIPLYMRITVNGKKTEMSIHRSIDAKLWNSNSGCAIGNTKIAKDVNSYLMSVQTSIYDYFKLLREKEIEITPTRLKNKYLCIEENDGKKIIELYQEHNDKINKLINIDYSPDTVQRYETSLKHTQDFIKQKYNKEDLYLDELNNEFIVDYEIYFKTIRKCSHNTGRKIIELYLEHNEKIKSLVNIDYSPAKFKQ